MPDSPLECRLGASYTACRLFVYSQALCSATQAAVRAAMEDVIRMRSGLAAL